MKFPVVTHHCIIVDAARSWDGTAYNSNKGNELY